MQANKLFDLGGKVALVTGGSAIEHSPEAWRKVMGLNVDACFHVAREVARRSMIPNNSGKIINIASIAGFGGSRPDGGVFSVAYNTSKGALITLTQALATEWGKHNINVNAICPGYFPTKLSAGLAERADEIAKVTPLAALAATTISRGRSCSSPLKRRAMSAVRRLRSTV